MRSWFDQNTNGSHWWYRLTTNSNQNASKVEINQNFLLTVEYNVPLQERADTKGLREWTIEVPQKPLIARHHTSVQIPLANVKKGWIGYHVCGKPPNIFTDGCKSWLICSLWTNNGGRNWLHLPQLRVLGIILGSWKFDRVTKCTVHLRHTKINWIAQTTI